MRASRPARLLLPSLLLASGVAAAAEPVAYCYRTLADIVCYLAPDGGRERRYVGSYGPVSREVLPPAATRATCPRTPPGGPRELRRNTGPNAPACSAPGSRR